MHTFQDDTGTEWPVTLNVAAAKRVRDLLDVNLAVHDEALIRRLAADPILLADVLYVICKPIADERNVSDVQFGEALAGDAIDAAAQALMAELILFTPPGRREILTKAKAKQDHLERLGLQMIADRLDGPEIEATYRRKVDEMLDEAFLKMKSPATAGGASTDSPPSPA